MLEMGSESVRIYLHAVDFLEINTRSGAPQSTVGGGQRSSSATAYLEPILSRENLDVLIQTTVTRLIPTGSSKGKPIFSKVEVAAKSTCRYHLVNLPGYCACAECLLAKRVTVTARKEVVLSAGAIGTPQILMLSGIGDRNSLEAMGIKSQLHLPDVGQNLVDHPIFASFFNVTSKNTGDDIFRNMTIFNADLAQWTASKNGIFTNLPSSGAGFLRLSDNATIFSNFSDPAPGEAGSTRSIINKFKFIYFFFRAPISALRDYIQRPYSSFRAQSADLCVPYSGLLQSRWYSISATYRKLHDDFHGGPVTSVP